MFVYHAQASSLSGSVRRPRHHVIDSTASSSLSGIGGTNSNRTGKFELEGIISIESAFTQVTGSFDSRNQGYSTQAKSVIEGFRLQEVVTADRIVAQYSSLYRIGASEPEIRPIGTQFINLRINGKHIEPNLNLEHYCRHSTYSDLRKVYQSKEGVRQSLDNVNLWKHKKDDLPEHLRHIPFPEAATHDFPEDGVVCCTLLQKPLEVAGADCRGHMIHIPDFGKIFIAEFHVRRKSRRLTMLRFDLGSPLEALFAAGELEGNGSPIP